MKKHVLKSLSIVSLLLCGCQSSNKKIYSVTWLNYDGTILEIDDVFNGKMPKYNGLIPTKTRDYSNEYIFSGWTPALKNVFENQVYTAIFETKKDLINFTISYELNGGENSLNNPATYTIEDAIIFENPHKNGYIFQGWFDENNTKIESIECGSFGDIQLKAKWEANKNNLSVTSNNAGGKVSINYGEGYSNELITVVATPFENCLFAGWYNGTELISSETVYSFIMPTEDYSLVAHFYTSDELDIKHARKPIILEEENKIIYGLYPQKNINDNNTIKALEGLEAVEKNGWYLYNGDYYTNVVAKPYFSNLRFDNGDLINENSTYWFKCEPIVWDIYDQKDGKCFLMSEMLLDLQPFCSEKEPREIEGSTIYANNYKYSDLRKWLITDFYNSAFCFGNDSILVTEVNNGPTSTAISSEAFTCENTFDKVYSLSYQDSINTNYGFESDDHAKCKKRSCKVTDYSKAKGSYTSRIDDYLGNGYYWLRSPHQGYTDHAWIVDYDGMNYPGYEIDNPSSSVRPCIAIDIN